MVHQRTRPPPQAAGRGGYRGVNQTTKCLNCGFGRGQFGVEFCEDYCSLDCYTSAKVTGRNLTRDSRCNRNTDVQAAPWPRGLLVEAPPAPKPWRGRTWSSDNITWRTGTTSACNSNLSADESSSIESVADWSGGVGADVGVGGGGGDGGGGVRGAGGGADCGLRFGVAGEASSNVATAERRSSPSRAVISGGWAASSSGVSGGRSAEDGGCSDEAASRSSGDAAQSSCCDEGVPDEGSRMQRRRDAAINCPGRDASGSGRVGVGDGDNNGVGGGGTVNILRRDLPPLAPVPRTGAFRQQHRRVQSAVDTRTVAFAPTPPQATPQATPNPPAQNAGAGVSKPYSFLPAAGGQIQPELCGVTMVGALGGVTAVGVTPVTPLRDASSSRAAGSECGGGGGEPGGGGGTAGSRLGGKGLEDLEGGRGKSSGVSGTGTGASAAAVGRVGGAGGGGICKNATGVDGAAAVESTAVIGQAAGSTAVIGQEAESTAVISQEAVATAVTGQAADSTAVIGQEGSGERVPSMDAMMIGTRCGASAGAGTGAVAEGEDVEVMKSIMSCETVRTYPTTAAIRQWRHMFLP